MSAPLPDQAPGGTSQWHVDDSLAYKAIEIVDRSGMVPALLTWREAEHARLEHHPGGAPETFPAKALVVAMLLAVLLDRPQHFTEYAELLFQRISPHMRSVLGVPDPPDLDDRRAWAALHRRVRTRFHSLLDAVDPSPLPKNRRLPPEDFDHRVTQRRQDRALTDEVLATRRERLTWLANALLEASVGELPRSVRRHWNGSSALDATNVPAFARQDRRTAGRGRRSARTAITHSADPDAGLYVRTTDDDLAPRGTQKLKAAIWAYEATLVVMGSDDPTREQSIPSLVVGMAALHRPGSDVGRNGVAALASVVARGHPTAWLAADRAYSNAVATEFQLPARALGYDLVLDYKVDQLGIQESFGGAKLVDGGWYCASIPDVLAFATLDFRRGRITQDTWRARIEARRAFTLRPKAKADEQGHVRLICPAGPGAPTAGCELKPESIPQALGKTRIPVTADLLENPPPVCAQQSLTFPPDAGAKFVQLLAHESAEWAKTYATLRSTIEGINGIAKDGAHSALGDPSRRRVRGVAAQTIFVALALCATNIRRIRSFLAKARADDAGVLRTPRPRRRVTRDLRVWAPEVVTRGGAPPP